MTTQSAFIRFRVTEDEKKQFEAWCQNQNISPSEALRKFVKAQVSTHQCIDRKDKEGVDELTESRWKVVNTRLTKSEYQGLKALVQTESTTVSKWLLRAIRQRILDGPQLRSEEIQAITQALFRLQSVGRNLNQLVKAMHSSSHTSVEAFEIRELRASIQATTGSITSLIKAASMRDFDYV